jgi:hypothetical protein
VVVEKLMAVFIAKSGDNGVVLCGTGERTREEYAAF